MRLALMTISAALFLVTAAVNLEVPLYQTYAEVAGFGNGLTAIVFAAYVAGLLPVLLLLGGLSDRLGRKPVLLEGLLSASLATALMILSPNMQTLPLTRLSQLYLSGRVGNCLTARRGSAGSCCVGLLFVCISRLWATQHLDWFSRGSLWCNERADWLWDCDCLCQRCAARSHPADGAGLGQIV